MGLGTKSITKTHLLNEQNQSQNQSQSNSNSNVVGMIRTKTDANLKNKVIPSTVFAY
jgi:hypothetical protein